MTITKRNRLIRSIASTLAERDGRDAVLRHEADVAATPEGRHYTRCCDHAHESAAHDTYGHLTDRRVYHSPTTGRAHLPIGLPELQHRLGDAEAMPAAGWVKRAARAARQAGLFGKPDQS